MVLEKNLEKAMAQWMQTDKKKNLGNNVSWDLFQYCKMLKLSFSGSKFLSNFNFLNDKIFETRRINRNMHFSKKYDGS